MERAVPGRVTAHWAPLSVLATALSTTACGGDSNPGASSTPAASGRGTVTLLVAVDGSVIVSAGFERDRDCAPVIVTGPCGVENTLPRFPDCAGTGPTIANAGPITITGGTTSAKLVPDNLGFYTDTAIPGLDRTAPVHVSAEGAEVPPFDGDVEISGASFTLGTPLNGATVPKATDLAVSWTANGTADTATVRVIGETPSGSLTIACAFPPAPPSESIPSHLFTEMDPTKRTFVSLKPENATKVKTSGWAIDVVTGGVFDLREITLMP